MECVNNKGCKPLYNFKIKKYYNLEKVEVDLENEDAKEDSDEKYWEET